MHILNIIVSVKMWFITADYNLPSNKQHVNDVTAVTLTLQMELCLGCDK